MIELQFYENTRHNKSIYSNLKKLMKVKIFTTFDETMLQSLINEWLDANNNLEIHEIKYCIGVSHNQNTEYSALILYDELTTKGVGKFIPAIGMGGGSGNDSEAGGSR